MQILTRKGLQRVAAHREAGCVAVYLPLASGDREEALRRYDRLVCQAEKQLGHQQQLDRAPATFSDGLEASMERLAAIRQQLEGDSAEWERAGSLAILVSPSVNEVFGLPIWVEPQVCCGGRFDVSALVPMMLSASYYYILALDLEETRLYQATETGLCQFDMEHVRQNAPAGREGWSSAAHFMTSTAPTPTRLADATTVKTTFQEADATIRRTLAGEGVPMVLASVGFFASIYRRISSYPGLLDLQVPGHPQMWSLEELHQAAQDIVGPMFLHEKLEAWAFRGESAKNGKLLKSPARILEAAENGYVSILFVEPRLIREATCGQLDVAEELPYPATDRSGGSMIARAAFHTWMGGGRVYASEILDENSPLLAVLRPGAQPAAP